MADSKICEEDLECDSSIAEKLKSTGRISLSDITAATIGPLDADIWETDQSDDSNNTVQNSVHRPWAIETDTKNESEVKGKDFEITRSQGTRILKEPHVLTSAINYGQQYDGTLPKKIRLETDTQPTYSNSATEYSKGKNSKLFKFSELAQSADWIPLRKSAQGRFAHSESSSGNIQENYSALTSTIKQEPHQEHVNKTATIVSGSRHAQTQFQPWTPSRTQSGPFKTSISVGTFPNTATSGMLTFSNSLNPHHGPSFQPWTQGTQGSGFYSPSTPLTKQAVLLESSALHETQQLGYVTPVSKQRQTFTNQSSYVTPVSKQRQTFTNQSSYVTPVSKQRQTLTNQSSYVTPVSKQRQTLTNQSSYVTPVSKQRQTFTNQSSYVTPVSKQRQTFTNQSSYVTPVSKQRQTFTNQSSYVTPVSKQRQTFTNQSSYVTPVSKQRQTFTNQSSYVTPVRKQRQAMNDAKPIADSPGFDSRFNDSLTNLLGSSPGESPISKNPFFNALQNALESDCKKEIVPQSLVDIHSNKQETENIFVRERRLHERFNALQEPCPDDVRQLSGFYRYQSALIETERFRTLHECNYPLSYKDVVNKHYDDQLHCIMDRVEQSVVLLENSNKENKFMNSKGGKPRPHLNKEAVKIMEDWYEQNLDHPYPSSATYDMLAIRGNVGVEQVKKWFANKRNRTHNTRTLTEIAMKKRKLNLLSN